MDVTQENKWWTEIRKRAIFLKKKRYKNLENSELIRVKEEIRYLENLTDEQKTAWFIEEERFGKKTCRMEDRRLP